MLDKEEKAYLKTGLLLITVSGPIQAIALIIVFLLIDERFIMVEPTIVFSLALIASLGLQFVIFKSLSNKEDFEYMQNSLGITALPIWHFHGGIIMITRIAVIYAVRLLFNRDFRRKALYPYIFIRK